MPIVFGQDTISFPLKISAGVDILGPAVYYFDKNVKNIEGFISTDINQKMAFTLGGGYLNYRHSQYNYEYLNEGYFLKTGVDFNIMAPEKSLGKYWIGLGLKYGLSIFNWEIPSYTTESYWGNTTSSVKKQTNWGHFLEVSPGARTEVFKNFTIGWNLSLRMLVYSGTGKNMKPVYFPGFGNGSKTFSTGVNYFLIWNIPLKKIKVIPKKEEPSNDEVTETTVTTH